MITNKNKVKTMVKHVIINANLIVQHVIQIKYEIMKDVTVTVKIILAANIVYAEFVKKLWW